MIDRKYTATVYLLCENKVLLHMHKKYKRLFPVGGHIEKDELPHEAAIREVKEEAGIDIAFPFNSELNLGGVKNLPNPNYTLYMYNGKDENILDFVYFVNVPTTIVKPMNGESRELFWLTKEEILTCNEIPTHVRTLALEALKSI